MKQGAQAEDTMDATPEEERSLYRDDENAILVGADGRVLERAGKPDDHFPGAGGYHTYTEVWVEPTTHAVRRIELEFETLAAEYLRSRGWKLLAVEVGPGAWDHGRATDRYQLVRNEFIGEPWVAEQIGPRTIEQSKPVKGLKLVKGWTLWHAEVPSVTGTVPKLRLVK